MANNKVGIYRLHGNLFVLILINWIVEFDMKQKFYKCIYRHATSLLVTFFSNALVFSSRIYL
jgi:hypothetical protein